MITEHPQPGIRGTKQNGDEVDLEATESKELKVSERTIEDLLRCIYEELKLMREQLTDFFE